MFPNGLILQWNAEIRTSMDFGQTTLVREQKWFERQNVRNPNDFVWIWDVRTIDQTSVQTSRTSKIQTFSANLDHFIYKTFMTLKSQNVLA